MKYSFAILTTFIIFLLACRKTETVNPNRSSGTTYKSVGPAVTDTPIVTSNPPFIGPSNYTSKTILVDASRDGGVWWFPQSVLTGFVATNYHQGKILADYFRTHGYKVDEIGRGIIITKELLSKYSIVIRAGGDGNYTQNEIAAYDSFLNRRSSLLLLQDHLAHSTNDQLSAHLGVAFEGVHSGTITSFGTHPVTTSVTSFPFLGGSLIRYPDPAKMTIIGSLSSISGDEGFTNGIMGVLHHPTSKVFFIGDINGIETIPQPFTANLINWMF